LAPPRYNAGHPDNKLAQQRDTTLDPKADTRLTELSARLDKTHADLTHKLDELYQLREASDGEQWREYESQIRALKEQEIRLLKSKNTAWMAHWLRTDGEVEVVDAPHRTLGLILIGISIIGAVGLGILWWYLQSTGSL
jgi:hypothetical protein